MDTLIMSPETFEEIVTKFSLLFRYGIKDLSALRKLKQLDKLSLDIRDENINSLKGLPTLTKLKIGN